MAATTPNTYSARAEEPRGAVQQHTIQAHGFHEEDSLTTFTDSKGQKVYALRSDRVLSIERTSTDS
ncbi:hypothetical protein ACFTTN_21770 [Streptomyces niveus]|uniref:hypothetical protein n=1 Tax=Streptomyces niveus TaxID=193462 RepID=UPI0036456215